MLQLITLRKIQSRVVTDIVSWPGKDKEGAAAVTDRHAGDRNRYGVLFLRFEIRLPDAEIPKLYGAAGNPDPNPNSNANPKLYGAAGNPGPNP